MPRNTERNRDPARPASNRLFMKISGRRLRAYSIVKHVGRRSGREYVNPASAYPLGDGFVIPILYGLDSQWVRNVLDTGRLTLVTYGREHALERPELIPKTQALPAFPAGSGAPSSPAASRTSCGHTNTEPPPPSTAEPRPTRRERAPRLGGLSSFVRSQRVRHGGEDARSQSTKHLFAGSQWRVRSGCPRWAPFMVAKQWSTGIIRAPTLQVPRSGPRRAARFAPTGCAATPRGAAPRRRPQAG
jgi:hypothetical protein